MVFTLPPSPWGRRWQDELDTAVVGTVPADDPLAETTVTAAARSMRVLRRIEAAGPDGA
jgi:hypothetical protein